MSGEKSPEAGPEVVLNDEIVEKLVQAARQAEKNAYAPYSNKPQGAAVLSADGMIFSGASLEFCTYGGSVSAETACLASAVSSGKRRFKALAIHPFDWPAGVVRQYFVEFGADIHLVVPNKDGGYRLVAWPEILPEYFSPVNLEVVADEKARQLKG